MKRIAYHLLGKCFGVDSKILNNPKFIKKVLFKSAKDAKLTVVKSVVHHHKLSNGKHQGVSAVLIVEESHLAIFTWPEHQYCVCDILTCGNEKSARSALHSVVSSLCPSKMETLAETEVV